MGRVAWPVLGVALVAACDDPPRTAPDAGAEGGPKLEAPAPPAAEGCARTGSLEGVESDPACALSRASDNVMREVQRQLTVSAEVDPPVVIAGSSATVRIALVNGSQSEMLVVLDALPRGARTDWSRIAGPPEPRAPLADPVRPQFALTTLDAHDHNVDAVPTLPGAAPSATPVPKLVGIRLRPGGKLTQNATWWALRIPAPYPPVTDDAGHRFVPKTSPVSLPAGDYGVTIDVPLHGLTAPERTIMARVHVERATAPPGADAAPH
jgi:hypothetical protein